MNRYTLQLVDGPATEPVSLAEVLYHLNAIGPWVPADAEWYISNVLIPSARIGIENELGRLLGEQTWEMGLPNWYGLPNFYGLGAMISAWPAALQTPLSYGRAISDYFGPSSIPFPRPPLISVRSVKYTKDDMTEVVLQDLDASPIVTSDLFFIETAAEPGLLFLKPKKTWPTDSLAPGYPVKIRFTAGMTNIPENIKSAVLMTVAHLFANRESVVVSDSRVQAVEVPQAIQWLCDPHRYEEYK